MQKPVLLVSAEAKTVAAVNSVLQSNGRSAVSNVFSTFGELTAGLRTTPEATIVVDLDPDPVASLARLDPIIGQFSAARFLAISSSVGQELLLRAMQVGVRQFVSKSDLQAQLPLAVSRLNMAEGHGASGRLFTVLSAGGGCGATTMAVNLAYELRRATSQSVLLVDMDTAYGAIASYLGLDARFGLANVLSDHDRIDAELLRSSTQTTPNGLSVLLSPATTDPLSPKPLAIENLTRALEVCRTAYANTLIDAPRLPIPVAATLARASDLTLIVFQMNVKDVRMASAILSALVDEELPRERIALVANRYGSRRQMISLEEADKLLGGLPIACVRNDFRATIRGINFGQPLESVAPRCASRKDIRKVAEKLLKVQPGASRS